MYQRYLNTDTEQQKVSLPPPTQECFDNRVDVTLRCSATDRNDLIGNEPGSCDYKPQTLRKALVPSLNPRLSNAATTSELLWSPAYDFMDSFTFTELQFGQVADYWINDNQTDIRAATCRWVVENLESLFAFVPKSYPRVLEQDNFRGMTAAMVLGVVATLTGVAATIVTHLQRETKMIRCAQIDFLWLILAGITMVALAGLITSIRPSDGTCIASLWLVSLGYTLLLVPLIVKVFAINKMLQAAESFRRVKLQRSQLHRAVAVISLVMMIFLAAWTAIDPPQREKQYELTGKLTAANETVVIVHPYCASSDRVWVGTLFAWNFVILLIAAVLAFMSRKMPSDFRETQTLAMLIYSNFLFAVLRAVFMVLGYSTDESGWNQTDLTMIRSILYSCDMIATVLIYFVPKFINEKHQTPISTERRNSVASEYVARIRMRVDASTIVVNEADRDNMGTVAAGTSNDTALSMLPIGERLERIPASESGPCEDDIDMNNEQPATGLSDSKRSVMRNYEKPMEADQTTSSSEE